MVGGSSVGSAVVVGDDGGNSLIIVGQMRVSIQLDSLTFLQDTIVFAWGDWRAAILERIRKHVAVARFPWAVGGLTVEGVSKAFSFGTGVSCRHKPVFLRELGGCGM